MRKFVLILGAILAFAMALAFFSFEKPTAGLPPDAKGRGALIVAVGTDCGSLDPGYTNTLADFRIIRSVYERLLRTPYGGGAPEPACAQALPEISQDGLTYRLTIRPQAKWSNGDPVLAEDFRYAWMRVMLPDTGSRYASLMDLVAGAKEFAAWRDQACELADALNARKLDALLKNTTPQDAEKNEKLRAFLAQNPWLNDEAQRTPKKVWERTQQAFDRLVGLKADGRDLSITLAKPTPYFTQLLPFPTFSPVHRASLEARREFLDDSVRIRHDIRYFLPGTLVGNGPYRLDEWVLRQRITLNQNPYYWDKDAMGNIRLVQRVVAENAIALGLLRDGALDIVLDLANPDLQTQLVASKAQRHDVHATPVAGTYYYLFNCRPEVNGRKNPLANPKVRRALAACINRETLTRQVTRLNQPPAKALVPPSAVPGYAPPVEAGVDFDPAQAKKWLAESGEKVETLSLLFNATGAHKNIAVAIAKQWEDTLNITVRLDTCEFNPMLDRRHAGNFEVTRAGWYGDYADPTTFLDMFVTGDSNNDGAYSNPKYDGLMKQAQNERDQAKRFAILRQAEALLLQDAPLATIYTQVDVKLFDAAKNDLKPDAWSDYRFECVPSKRR